MQVLSGLEDKLCTTGWKEALLLGCQAAGSSPILVDCCLPELSSSDQVVYVPDVLGPLPEGIVLLGVYGESKELSTALLQRISCQAGCKSAQDLVLCFREGQQLCFEQHGQKKEITSVNWSPVDALGWMHNLFALVRCQISLTLRVYQPLSSAPAASSVQPTSLEKGIRDLQQNLQGTDLAFRIASSPSATQWLVTATSSGRVADLVAGPGVPCCAGVPVLNAQPLTCQAKAASQPAPVFEYQAVPPSSPTTLLSCPVDLDVLCYVPLSTPQGRLGGQWLVPALHHQLETVMKLLQHTPSLVKVTCHHFLPPGLPHHLTLSWPQLSSNPETTELKLTSSRLALHRAYGLPENRPMLRQANATNLSAAGLGSGDESSGGPGGRPARLRDVHLGLTVPGVGGTVSLIQGSYDYYHYMQDRFNDAGWGCAYRSLQTICSWFQVNSYTDKLPPTHREIQSCLVKLGDKEASFVGSSQWIGAIELSYVLDDYLGVTSKIITINQGADIPSRARELAAHFNSQGTPIMIGGGVLAYTLLGVAFNDLTGDCAFLILDPHYTGGEDLRKIQSGGWIGWKKLGDNAAAGGALFVKDAFYNFLCPQRPSTV